MFDQRPSYTNVFFFEGRGGGGVGGGGKKKNGLQNIHAAVCKTLDKPGKDMHPLLQAFADALARRWAIVV